jgi:hypothetical protein
MERLQTILALAGSLACCAAAAKPPVDFHNPPSVAEWFRSAADRLGNPCCGEADGFREGIDYPWRGGRRVLFSQWERRPDGYWVKFDGRWIAAPDRSVVRANPLGVAVVWVWRRGDATVVRCFAPASES